MKVYFLGGKIVWVLIGNGTSGKEGIQVHKEIHNLGASFRHLSSF